MLNPNEMTREDHRLHRRGYSAGKDWATAADPAELRDMGVWLQTAQRSFGNGGSVLDAIQHVTGTDLRSESGDELHWPSGFAQGVIDEYRRQNESQQPHKTL